MGKGTPKVGTDRLDLKYDSLGGIEVLGCGIALHETRRTCALWLLSK